MFPANAIIKFQASNPTSTTLTLDLDHHHHNHLPSSLNHQRHGSLINLHGRIPSLSLPPSFSSLSLTTPTHPTPSSLSSSVGSPPSVHLSHWNLNHQHIHLLSALACIAAISASWLFFSAIPALLAFKRAAESLEKLLDVTREELPDTMAAARLSGMEISDLTMELSDLGQEITQGVRNSTRAVRLAEDRLRRLANMAPTALLQERTTPKTKKKGPGIARTARSLREGIENGRAVFQVLFNLTQFSRWAINYLTARGNKK